MSEKILQQQSVNTALENADENNSLKEQSLETDYVETEEITEVPADLVQVLDEIGLDDAQKDLVCRVVSMSESHSGPLPHPRILAGYEKIVPGAANRILAMAENEAEHRHSVDDRCIRIDSRDSLLGIICAFVLGLTAMIVGALIAIKSPETAGVVCGTLLAGGGLAAIVGAFITGTKATWKLDKNDKK